MKKAPKSLCLHGFRETISVENSKRRHMLSLMGGNFRFFERILSTRKIQDPKFVSKSSGRAH